MDYIKRLKELRKETPKIVDDYFKFEVELFEKAIPNAIEIIKKHLRKEYLDGTDLDDLLFFYTSYTNLRDKNFQRLKNLLSFENKLIIKYLVFVCFYIYRKVNNKKMYDDDLEKYKISLNYLGLKDSRL